MRRFFFEYRLIILAVSLPLMLILVLLAVLGISRWLAEPPAYPVLYAHFDARAVTANYDFRIAPDGRLQILWREFDEPLRPYGPGLPGAPVTLVLHDAERNTSQFFPIQPPENPGTEDEFIPMGVPAGLSGLRFVPGDPAPDGTRFEAYSSRSGGLFADLFGGGGRSSKQHLFKDGVAWSLPDAGGSQSWHSPALIGWVVEAGDDASR